MNELFVNIKVDREERPDLDAIYMDAVQAMTGQGGWPMSVWLTPDGQPFHGGTYYPKEPRYGMPSFRRCCAPSPMPIAAAANKWTGQAERLTAMLRRTAIIGTATTTNLGQRHPRWRRFGHLRQYFDERMAALAVSPSSPADDARLLPLRNTAHRRSRCALHG
jgi:uncharacterized protein YyaL (SSP411 family)